MAVINAQEAELWALEEQEKDGLIKSLGILCKNK
jgi:hypothetical protein